MRTLLILAVFALPLAFNPYSDLPFEPLKAGVLRLGGGAAVLLLCWALMTKPAVRQRLGKLAQQPLFWAVLAYGGFQILATALSAEPGLSWWGASDRHGTLTTLSALLLGVGAALALSTQGSQFQFLRLVVAASVPVCLYGLAQSVGLDPLPWLTDSVSPVLSTLGRSNFLGAYLALLVPVVMFRLLQRGTPTEDRSTWRFVLGLLVLVLFLTQARAGWLAGVVGLAASVGVVAWQARSKSGILAVLGIVAVGLALLFVQNRVALSPVGSSSPASPSAPEVSESFQSLRATSMERRLIIWQATLPLLAERPLLGHGPERFLAVFNRRYPPGSLYAGRDVIVDDPHNLFLQEMFASGALGLVSLLAVLLLALWHARGLPALLGSLMAFIVQAQFTPDVVVTTFFFWLFVGLILGRSSDTQPVRARTTTDLAGSSTVSAPS